MVAHWMRVGFVHGVMNTDNMSILGLTIDYGPYGWLDDFDPTGRPTPPTPQGRRYRFGQQPQIAQWNLPRASRGDARSLRGTEGTRALRRPASRLGPQPRGLLDAVLQFLSAAARARGEAAGLQPSTTFTLCSLPSRRSTMRAPPLSTAAATAPTVADTTEAALPEGFSTSMS
jgi:hypothetical protein